MFKKAYLISFPIFLGVIGGIILCYEFNTYVSATSRLRLLDFVFLAYLISTLIPSIISKFLLATHNYRNRLILGFISLTGLTIVNEINFWNNDRFPMKNWASEPNQMLINSLIQLAFGIVLILVINIRIK